MSALKSTIATNLAITNEVLAEDGFLFSKLTGVLETLESLRLEVDANSPDGGDLSTLKSMETSLKEITTKLGL